jgi:hypothetical protein
MSQWSFREIRFLPLNIASRLSINSLLTFFGHRPDGRVRQAAGFGTGARMCNPEVGEDEINTP